MRTTESKPHPIVRFAIERRVTMGMCVLGVLVLGWLSLERLPLELLPAISSPRITVVAPYPSSSPEETEREIVRPLEDALGTIPGIDSLSANASAESGSVTVSFEHGTDMDLAAVEVRDRVDRVRGQLPADLRRVDIRRFQTSDMPVTRFFIAAPWPIDRLYRFAEEVIQRRLQRLEGVADVSISGLRTSQVLVQLLPDRLAAHQVGPRQVIDLLRANNLAASAGVIREGSNASLVRVMGELSTLQEIEQLPLGTAGLRLGDVATVSVGYPEQDSYSFLNGSEALTVGVYRASTTNLLEVVDRVRQEMTAIAALPEAAGLQASYYFDSSRDVRQGLAQLRDAGLLGGGLAVAFIFLFLRRLRTTLLAALAIPISVIVTFVLLFLARQAGLTDVTLNIMSLMGLMLAVGMLVDSAIVVIESIFRHRQELGREARSAALAGASEVALPVLASTLTTVCVFVPIIFLTGGGRFTIFMSSIAVTTVVVIVASTLVALTVVPMVAAQLLQHEEPRRSPLLERITALYGRVLRFALHHRLAFAALSVVLLAASWHLYQGIGRSFFPPSFERQLSIKVDTPKSYSLAQKRTLYDEVYRRLDDHRQELEIADIAYSFNVGSGRTRGHRRGNQFTLYLTAEQEGKRQTGEIRDRVSELLPQRPGVTFTCSRSMRGRRGSGSGGIEVVLSGYRPEIVEALSTTLTATLARLPELRDVDSSLESGDEQLLVRPVTERTLQAGLSSQGVASTISGALSSRSVSDLRTPERELELVVRYREQDRQTLDQLLRMPLLFGNTPLTVGSVTEVELSPGSRSIVREDRQATVRLTAETGSGLASYLAAGSVQSALANLDLPAGYDWSMGEDFRQSREEESNAAFMLLLAVTLVYLIMAALFEDFFQPLTIMLSVPFALVGVGIVMRLTGQSRGNMTDLGLVILAGLVVNNAIVLVDQINRLRRWGLPVAEAIVEGGRHRLRPIVMTACTTILGLAPMVAPFFLPGVLGTLEGRAAFWAPVGLVILGGLTTSTFLTLLVIPIFYSLTDDCTGFCRRVLVASRTIRTTQVM